MKIAIVHPYPSRAGLEAKASGTIYRDRVFATLLEQHDHQVKGFRTTRGMAEVIVSMDDYADWTNYPIDREDVDAPGARVGSSRMVEEVLGYAPDVLIVKGSGTSIGQYLFELHNGPFVTIVGGGYRDRTLMMSELVLTENEEQERFLSMRIGLGRTIRMPKLVSPIFAKKHESMPKEFDVVVVSKFSRHKNHAALLPLLEHNVSILFIGDGEVREEFERRAQDCRARVTFSGFVESEEVARLLHRSRVLVHPSLSEGFPRAVVEAMAAGVPSVCLAGVVGPPLVDGENGLLVRENELVPGTLALLEDESHLETLGVNALATNRKEFSVEALQRTTERVNQKLNEAVKRYTSHGSKRRKMMTVWLTVLNAPRASLRFSKALTRSIVDR